MLRVFFDERFGCSGLPLCEIFLINSLSFTAVFTRVCWCLCPERVRARAGPCVSGRVSERAFSAVLWNAASLGSFESTLGFQNRKAFDLFFLAVSLPGREPLLSLSPSPLLSQLGWTHTWKCWPGSTLGPNLVIQRRGRARGGGGWEAVVEAGWGSRGWKSQPPQDQRQPRLRPANPTSALYKDLPPHPNFDSHAISHCSDRHRKHTTSTDFFFGLFSFSCIFSWNIRVKDWISSSLLTLSPTCLCIFHS